MILIDRFTNGLADFGVQEFVCQQAPLTYPDALLHASNQSATKTLMHANRMGAAAAAKMYGKKGGGNGGLFHLGGDGSGDTRTCYFCREVGHIKTSCAAFKKSKQGQGQGDRGKGRGRGGRRPFFPRKKTVGAVGGDEEEKEEESGN
jgi:hypothetical protein